MEALEMWAETGGSRTSEVAVGHQPWIATALHTRRST